mgnify:CR=1 FL=1
MATIKISIIGKEKTFDIYDNAAKMLIDLCHRLASLNNYEINEEAKE